MGRRGWTVEESDRGRGVMMRNAAARREARFEDIDFFLSQGYSPREIAKRLDLKPGTISRQARRWGRDDIARIFERRGLR